MGAPQAAGQGPLRGSRPGALFRCPITPEEYDCERVDIDGEGAWKSRDDKFISGENNPINTVSGFTNGFGFYAYFPQFPFMFYLSESEQREQTQPVAGSYCQKSGDWRESGGE